MVTTMYEGGEPYGPEIPDWTPVDVYWNLHRNCFSVRSRRKDDRGIVIAHVYDRFVLADVKFVVNQAGRERVLREKRKNVHAFVRGLWVDPRTMLQPFTSVYYNPYEGPTFRDNDMNPISWTTRCSGFILNDRPQLRAEILDKHHRMQ